jgi:hypothetical protein
MKTASRDALLVAKLTVLPTGGTPIRQGLAHEAAKR